jgi:hypothetical protein
VSREYFDEFRGHAPLFGDEAHIMFEITLDKLENKYERIGATYDLYKFDNIGMV